MDEFQRGTQQALLRILVFAMGRMEAQINLQVMYYYEHSRRACVNIGWTSKQIMKRKPAVLLRDAHGKLVRGILMLSRWNV